MQDQISEDKSLIGMLLQIGPRGGIQSEDSCCIEVLGNYPASSERPPRKFHPEARVSPRASPCASSPDTIVHPEARVFPCASSPVSSRVLSIVSRLTPCLVSRLLSRNRVNSQKSSTTAT